MTAKKKSTRKKSEKNSEVSNKPSKEQSNDMFMWKVGFFVVLGIAILLLIGLFFNGSGSGIIKTNTNNQNLGTGGKVLIEEFSDFECPFCKRSQETVAQIKQTYGSNVEFVFKHFPVHGPTAIKAHEAYECAVDQNKGDEYKKVLFDRQTTFSESQLKQWAVEVGLNADTFNACLDSGEKNAKVMADFDEGKTRGVSGTPTFFVNGERIVGAQPFATFQAAIDKSVQSGGTQNQNTNAIDNGEIEFLVIDDPTCTVCSTDQIIEVVETQLLPGVKTKTILVDSQEAQELINNYDVRAVPAYFFSKNVKDSAKYADLASALVEKEEHYYINPAATGTAVYIDRPTVEGERTMGSQNAPIVMVEYADFNCGYCKRFHDETFDQIKQNYIDTGKVLFVYKDFPVVGGQRAAEAAWCANEQGKFWEYYDILFVNSGQRTDANFKTFASQVGLDTTQFDSCLTSSKYVAQVTENSEEAKNFGMTGTPGFVIDGIAFSGALPYTNFQTILDELLAE